MSVFDVLSLIGGLCLFLFGMSIMEQGLEHRAGNGLKALLGSLSTNKLAGLVTGVLVTAVIQSSSATTVMVVGFVNSGLMSLSQSVNVIIGANIGTTVTAWVLSLAGISSDNFFVNLLKPSSFTPLLALVGIILYMTGKSSKRKDSGMILLGFAVLMFGMEKMSVSVAGLRYVPEFANLFVAFTHPLLGVIAGALLTAIIQSSSASVGILQALASTGAVSYGAAIPIIMGQNIGTCITAILSSLGTNKNARRAALVHLSFNIIGTAVWLIVFWLIKAMLAPALLGEAASLFGIAVFHSIFNVLCAALMLPMSRMLEKLVCRIIPDTKQPEKPAELDERLLVSPALALEQCRNMLDKIARSAINAFEESLTQIRALDAEAAQRIRDAEEESDRLEDILSTYLLKLSARTISGDESAQATEYMKLIGDYERIADHAVNIVESAEEMQAKDIAFSNFAEKEYDTIASAVTEILELSYKAFANEDLVSAKKTEPLEEVIDNLKELLRTSHILRLQRGECSLEAGFIWSDILTNLERVSDHCSNISGCVVDTRCNNMNIHQNLKQFRSSDENFREDFNFFREKYSI